MNKSQILKNLTLVLLFIFACLDIGINAQNTWVVSNDPGFFTADFDVIQDAVDAALSGDKIYVHGSSILYLTFTVDKKLHIIGSGFWKTENSIPDENVSPTTISGTVYLNPGSDSSIVEGIKMNACLINADNIVFRYNQICCHFSGNPIGGILQFIGFPVNTLIYGNYLNNSIYGSASGANVFNNILIEGYQSSPILWTASGGNINCLVQNNSISASITTVADVIFRNNIIQSANFSINNVVAQNNLFVDDDVIVDGVPTDSLGNGNIDNIDITAVWNLVNPSPDGKYQLIGNSMSNPAFGAGLNGVDCGAFGGTPPYRLSGIVKIPQIYEMDIPLVGDTTNMLNISLKAKSN